MANLPETPQWEEGVYQIEVSDPVLGGPDGISNRQGKQLASRTLYLKQQVEKGGSDLAKHIAAADPHTQYAPKASPTFTGTPTAPTPAANDNSKKLVTTEFVVRAIAALAGTAPETLDTLKELADALGNDPNFATTVLNKLAEKLAKDQNGADIPDPALFVKNLGLGVRGKTQFTKSGSWTCPDGVTTVYITGCAAGAGGAGGGSAASSSATRSASGGGGGGAGETAIRRTVTVVPGTTYTVTIGAGSSGGAGGIVSGNNNGTNSADAGSTSFGTLLTLAGGLAAGAGVGAGNPSPVGGTGGLPGGGQGQDGYTAAGMPVGMGGDGGSSPFGTSGSGGKSGGIGGSKGGDAAGYGAGGGGGGGTYGNTTGSGGNGGKGANGFLMIEW